MRSESAHRILAKMTPAQRKKSMRFWDKWIWKQNPHTKEGNKYLRQQLAKRRK